MFANISILVFEHMGNSAIELFQWNEVNWDLKNSNSPGRCVSEEFAVQQHHPADEVEAEEHGKREDQVKWHHSHVAVAIGM